MFRAISSQNSVNTLLLRNWQINLKSIETIRKSFFIYFSSKYQLQSKHDSVLLPWVYKICYVKYWRSRLPAFTSLFTAAVKNYDFWKIENLKIFERKELELFIKAPEISLSLNSKKWHLHVLSALWKYLIGLSERWSSWNIPTSYLIR